MAHWYNAIRRGEDVFICEGHAPVHAFAWQEPLAETQRLFVGLIIPNEEDGYQSQSIMSANAAMLLVEQLLLAVSQSFSKLTEQEQAGIKKTLDGSEGIIEFARQMLEDLTKLSSQPAKAS